MFKICFADHVIEVDNQYDYIRSMCTDYLTDAPAAFTVRVTEQEILAESTDGRSWHPAYLETLAVYRKICERLLEDDILLFHCSALAIDGRAILFTAPSGTGKSTHTGLWRAQFGDRVTMINDDKPLLHVGDAITVYGTAYAGKSNIHTNTKAETAAIVILHQAPENAITQLTARDAFPMLLNQTYRQPAAAGMVRTLQLVERLSQLPVFSLGCTISDEAVTLVYETLKERNIL